jgi:hypothetical protein
MIEKYYASHIKTSLDAAAINVMRSKQKKRAKAQAAGAGTWRGSGPGGHDPGLGPHAIN